MDVVLHTPLLPEHLAGLVPVHSTHAPVAAQALRLASPSAAHSLSTEQPWHLWLLPHKGAVPVQLVSAIHWTHAFPLVSQTGVAPAHAE